MDHLSVKRNIKIGTFHLGSTMADVLGSGVWNRVMIQDLGYAATPVGLLLALRYFLVLLAVWAGQQSDQTNLYGYRRLPWIMSGRVMMVIGYLIVAVSTVQLATSGALWWLGLIGGFLLVSIGYSISGSTFLALVYDRALPAQRGRAVGVVWTFLIAGYAVSGILFSRLLPEYESTLFIEFFVIISFLMLGIWIFALWGEEKRDITSNHQQPPLLSIRQMWQEAQGLWSIPSARLLMIFIMLSFLAGFMQDALLEPFGGDVFNLSVGETSRFQAFWGTTAILSSIAGIWGYRREYSYLRLSRWGVILLIITFIMLVIAALGEQVAMLRPALLLLGVGYGLWNIGTLGLMVENSRENQAGLDLGIWTMITTLSRGGAVLSGTLLFDLFAWLLGTTASAYATVFAIEALLLIGALMVLYQMAPRTESIPIESELLLAATGD